MNKDKLPTMELTNLYNAIQGVVHALSIPLTGLENSNLELRRRVLKLEERVTALEEERGNT